jgi:hypothetical protein
MDPSEDSVLSKTQRPQKTTFVEVIGNCLNKISILILCHIRLFKKKYYKEQVD